MRIKFHWGFSYVTHYMHMKHSLLGIRKVILSIITRDFFAIRNKQPMPIGTNRMCISRDDNCVNTMCFPRQRPTTARKPFTTISSTCVIRVVLSVSYLLVSSFVLNFLKTYFRSMPQLSKYESIWPNERFRKVLQSWRSRYLAPTESACTNILRPPANRMRATSSHLGKERSLRALNELQIAKKYFAAEGFNVKIPFISQSYTKAVATSFRQSHARTRNLVKYHPRVVFT